MAIDSSMSARIVRRLTIPCTPTELSAAFDKPLRTVVATLHQLRGQGRVKPLDRFVQTSGRKQRLWCADGSVDEIHELCIQECYERIMARDAEWSELAELIARRSSAQVKRMELAKGLA